MNLPEEVLDEILSHLPSDNGRTLRSCSLVSKSWLEPSRRLLFANIIIRRDNYQSWREKIPPTKTGLLHHIRMFTYFLRGDRHSDLCRVHTLRDYLPSFCNLKNLTLCNMTIEQTISENLELFSAFQHTLSSLSLGAISITWSSFVVLVGYFPNLTYLKLLGMLFQVDKRPVARVPHAWRGRLFVDLATRGPVGLPGDLFAELGPEYEELEILGAYEQRLISAVERSLKSLKVNLCNSTPTPGLSRCPELQQLMVAIPQPREPDRMLIASITSTNFEKLVFAIHPLIRESDLIDPCWVPFDDMICGLVERLQTLGYKRKLEVEFRAPIVAVPEIYHKWFLPKFKKKGRVRIVEGSSGKVWEW